MTLDQTFKSLGYSVRSYKAGVRNEEAEERLLSATASEKAVLVDFMIDLGKHKAPPAALNQATALLGRILEDWQLGDGLCPSSFCWRSGQVCEAPDR
ncbi:hypothetical protein C1T17_15565 [Sphingobium sp. SCG-1]|nr:hypothetical protein C1T17_15565 [Sphingobium sp. SCG-1]